MQAYGSNELDASLLLLPCVGFLPADDPRIAGTVAAIERHLVRDGFVLRYDTDEVDDALPPGEGAFLACSFWLVDAYMLQGRYDDAERLFRPARRPAQRRRPAERGIRSARQAAASAISRRPSRTSR